MTKPPQGDRLYSARILWVNTDKKFAMTYVPEVGRVTFSFDLDERVWAEDSSPIKGTKVVLSDLRMMDGGWRAFVARYLRPEDEGLK